MKNKKAFRRKPKSTPSQPDKSKQEPEKPAEPDIPLHRRRLMGEVEITKARLQTLNEVIQHNIRLRDETGMRLELLVSELKRDDEAKTKNDMATEVEQLKKRIAELEGREKGSEPDKPSDGDKEPPKHSEDENGPSEPPGDKN